MDRSATQAEGDLLDPSPPPTDDLSSTLREVNERLVLSSLREMESAEAAEHGKTQLGALLATLENGVVIADASGRIALVNDAARAALFLAPTVVPSVEELLALEFRSPNGSLLSSSSQPFRRALRGEVVKEEELLLVRPDGHPRSVMISATHIREKGAVAMVFVVLRDVTNRRQLEARVATTERLAAVGVLSAGMAHEINTPLAVVLGNVSYAMECLPELQDRLRAMHGGALVADRLDALVEALREANDGGLRIHSIIRDLTRFGRLDGGQRSTIQLVDVVEAALRMTRAHLTTCHVTRDDRSAPPIFAHDGQLTQVFINLLVNAAQASGPEGSRNDIVVATYTDDSGRAVAEVRDSGCGIPLALQGRVFEPFFTTKPVGKGSGLGLSVSHTIVESLGGQLSLESDGKSGTVFRIVLPPADPPGPPAPSSPPPAHSAPASSSRGRVLVIDDEPLIGRAIGRLLRADHDVTAVSSGREALARLTAGEMFDIVLCDLMMPQMTGKDVYAEVCRLLPDLAPRFVFITGGACTPATDRFLHSVPNVTLMKPLDPDALRKIVTERVATRDDGRRPP